MQFHLLGQLEAVGDDGVPIALPGHKLRLLLAILLMQPNRPVPAKTLIDGLWPEGPPPSARSSLQYYVHRLRQALGKHTSSRGSSGSSGGVLVTEAGGYLLRVGEGELDSARFAAGIRRAERARAAADLPAAAEALDEALALWRGPALADFGSAPFAQPHIARLEEERLRAIERRAELALELGQHAPLIAELEGLIRTNPLRERLSELLMRALYRSGRQADALGVYQAHRRRLAEHPGVEPGPDLRRLEQRILTQDPTLALPDPAATAPPAPETEPAPALVHAATPPRAGKDGNASGPTMAAAAAAGSGGEETATGTARTGIAGTTGGAARRASWSEPSGADSGAGTQGEERRVVTILVAGLVATPEVRDPEDVWVERAKALEPVLAAISRYGGTVLSVIGGTVTAVFGVPRARDDDAERAVRAALATQAASAPDAAPIRIGVDTGETVIAPRLGFGAATGQVALAGGVSGRVLDLATALCRATSPRGVLVGKAAWRATERRIDYQPEGDAWRALAPRSKAGVALDLPGKGSSGQLLERDQELSMLGNLLSRVRHERTPQLVTLIGAPGIGKTRLIAELGRQAEHDPDLITWRQGRSLAYGERDGEDATSDTALAVFWALSEVVRSHAGIADTDTPEAAGTKLARVITDLFPDQREAGTVTAQLRSLLHLDGGGGGEVGTADRQATFSAWVRFVAAVAAERPLILALEDLHWADAALLDFLDQLIDQAGPVPLLVVCTARPELLARRPGWAGGKLNAITVTLNPLSAAGSAKLLDSLLDAGTAVALDTGTREMLLTRAAGNPLFLEEYVRMLRDRPASAGDLPIPETVQQLITARIDALDEDRRLLQDLAVFGEPGWAEPLADLGGMPAGEVEAGLARLERQELLRRTRMSTAGNQPGYLFRHPLIREVAYRQLVRADRAERHLLVAGWLERRPDPPVDLLAHHYGEALALDDSGAPLPDDLRRRARQVFREAGDRALALSAWSAAARHYREALEVWPDADGRPELLYRLGIALMYGQHGGQDELTEARAALAAAGNQRLVTAIDGELRLLALIRGDAEGLDQLARPEQPELTSETALAVASNAVDLLIAQDRPGDAVRAARKVVDLAAEQAVPDAEGVARSVLGAGMLQLGDVAGEDEFRKAFALLGPVHHPLLEKIRWGFAWYLWFAGAMDRCAAAIAEGRQAMQAGGGTVMLDWFEVAQVTLDYSAGRWDQVVALVDRLSTEPSGENGLLLPWCLVLRGRVRLGRMDVDGALADARAAAEASISGRRPAQAAVALRCRALLAAGRREEASTLVDHLVAELHSFPEGSQATPDLAVAMADLGRPPGALPDGLPPTRWHLAVRALADGDPGCAADLYHQLGSPTDAADARLRAARQQAAGAPEAARATLAPAIELWRRAHALGHLRDADELLAHH